MLEELCAAFAVSLCESDFEYTDTQNVASQMRPIDRVSPNYVERKEALERIRHAVPGLLGYSTLRQLTSDISEERVLREIGHKAASWGADGIEILDKVRQRYLELGLSTASLDSDICTSAGFSGARGIAVLEWMKETDSRFWIGANAYAPASLGVAGLDVLEWIIENLGGDEEFWSQVAYGAGSAGEVGLPVLEWAISKVPIHYLAESAAWSAGFAGMVGLPVINRLSEFVEKISIAHWAISGATEYIEHGNKAGEAFGDLSRVELINRLKDWSS